MEEGWELWGESMLGRFISILRLFAGFLADLKILKVC